MLNNWFYNATFHQCQTEIAMFLANSKNNNVDETVGETCDSGTEYDPSASDFDPDEYENLFECVFP